MKTPGSKKGAHKKNETHTRSKYVDHSRLFVEWVNRLGLEKTFFGGWLLFLEERFQVRRMSILFLFSLVLAFLLHFDFDFPYQAKVDEIASSDIISPISFEIVDEVETEKKRVEADRSTPPVFDYDLDLYVKISNNIYQAFRTIRRELRQQEKSWPKKGAARAEMIKDFSAERKGAFEQLLGQTVSESTFEWLVERDFSVQIENLLIRTLEKWSESKIADDTEKQIPPDLEQVIVRVVERGGRGEEFTASRKSIKDLKKRRNFDISKISGVNKLSLRDQRNLYRLSRRLLVPNVTLNKQETAERKQRAKDGVLPVVISIKKNQVIAKEGQVITPLHITILREIQNRRSSRRQEFRSMMTAFLLVAIILVFFSFIRRFTMNRIVVENKDIAVMGLVTFIVVAITKVFLFIADAAFVTKLGSSLPEEAILFAAPVASGAMLVGLLIASGEVVWLFTIFLATVLGFLVDLQYSFVIVTVVGGIAAARGVYGCKKRNDVYMAGLRTGLVNSFAIFTLMTVFYVESDNYWQIVLWSVPGGFLSGILSAMIAMTLIPLLESAFNYTTDVRLMELSNLNHPLLKKMIVRAPGTYHHSLVVGSMVEAAAEEIGANPLLAKVMSYYHDIGKMEHAGYFIENQKAGQNPHDHLSPHMSKTILIAHVKDGVELGMKYKLGKPIIDGVVQHHGTTLISFFYNRALEQEDEDIDVVEEDEFRYPGPKPQFKEAALIMLADSIEAAARSLDEPTPVRLQNIVKNIIQRKFMDAQLDECNLTLKELSTIENSFVKILLGIYHQRIDYPKSAGGHAHERPANNDKVKKISNKGGPATA